MENGDPLIQVPYLFAYNKDAQDEDGFIAPVMAYCELPYVQNPEMRYCINTEKNRTACKESIMTVLQSYAEHTGIEVQDIQ